MKSNFVNRCVCGLQDQLYIDLKQISKDNLLVGRIAGLPIAVLDGLAELSKPLLKTLESLALMVVSACQAVFEGSNDNFIGFKDHYFDVFYHSDRSVKNSLFLASTALIIVPCKIILQAASNVYDPLTAESMSYSSSEKHRS